MTIAQERQFTIISGRKNETAEKRPEAASLVMPERELWNLVGPDGFEDKDTIFFSMTTVYQACQLIEEGRPAGPLIRRVGAMSFLSDDLRYQRLILSIVGGVESRDIEGLLAAQQTALCAALMISRDQRIWPRQWDGPSYRTNRVWSPKVGTNQRNEEPSPGTVAEMNWR